MLVLTSCDKEELAINEPTVSTEKDILTFATQEDFDKTLAKVNAMTKTERLAWEKQQGFKSFGTMCDEFYETINPANFKSTEDIKAFVAKNSDKIEFYTSSDGETYCVTKDFLSAERYLINKNQTCKINNKVIVYSSNDISENQSLFIKKAVSAVVNKANKSDDKEIEGPGIGDDDWYRIHVWLETKKVNQYHWTDLTIKNFYRALGVWFIKNNVVVKYKISYSVTDSNNNKHSFSVPLKTIIIGGAGNFDSKCFVDECLIGLYTSNPYFLNYSIEAENTITDSDGTCICKVTMNY